MFLSLKTGNVRGDTIIGGAACVSAGNVGASGIGGGIGATSRDPIAGKAGVGVGLGSTCLVAAAHSGFFTHTLTASGSGRSWPPSAVRLHAPILAANLPL